MPCIRLLRARQLGGLASELLKGFPRISSQEVLGSEIFRTLAQKGLLAELAVLGLGLCSWMSNSLASKIGRKASLP